MPVSAPLPDTSLRVRGRLPRDREPAERESQTSKKPPYPNPSEKQPSSQSAPSSKSCRHNHRKPADQSLDQSCWSPLFRIETVLSSIIPLSPAAPFIFTAM